MAILVVLTPDHLLPEAFAQCLISSPFMLKKVSILRVCVNGAGHPSNWCMDGNSPNNPIIKLFAVFMLIISILFPGFMEINSP